MTSYTFNVQLKRTRYRSQNTNLNVQKNETYGILKLYVSHDVFLCKET